MCVERVYVTVLCTINDVTENREFPYHLISSINNSLTNTSKQLNARVGNKRKTFYTQISSRNTVQRGRGGREGEREGGREWII